MFLNLDLYETYGIRSDIFQMTLDGKWTLDVLKDMTKDLDQDLNGDNAFKPDDFFGLGLQPTSELVDAFFSGADIKICKLSADKKKLTLSDFVDRDISAIEKITSIVRKIPYEDVNDIINLNFKVGKSLFLQHKLESTATHLRDMEDDYLILPMPKYDENGQYISCLSGNVAGFTAIPLTADPEFSGFITEALARWSHESLRPLAFDLVYKQKNARNERTADVLNIIFDSLYIMSTEQTAFQFIHASTAAQFHKSGFSNRFLWSLFTDAMHSSVGSAGCANGKCKDFEPICAKTLHLSKGF